MVIFRYNLNITTCGLTTVSNVYKNQETTRRNAGFSSMARTHQTYQIEEINLNIHKRKQKREMPMIKLPY